MRRACIAPLCRDLPERRSVDPIALREAIRDVVGDLAAECTDVLHEQCGRGHPIHIVIPIDDNPLSAMNRLQNALHSLLHVHHEKRIMKRLVLRMQEGTCRLCRAYPSVPKDLSDDRRRTNLACERGSLCRFLVHNPFFQHRLPPFPQ
mgnify:CR=1 FL=1